MKNNNTDLEIIRRAITGIVFNKFGNVGMSIEWKDGLIRLNVYDKPCRFENKKLIVDVNFIYEGISKTISEIEAYLIQL